MPSKNCRSVIIHFSYLYNHQYCQYCHFAKVEVPQHDTCLGESIVAPDLKLTDGPRNPNLRAGRPRFPVAERRALKIENILQSSWREGKRLKTSSALRSENRLSRPAL
jgi:hypothetical protein